MPQSRATTIWERAALPFTGAAAATFGLLSGIRRNRVFHPVGEAFTGMVTFDDFAAPKWGLSSLGSDPREALVRFSRGAGMPEPLPDVLGLAVKIPGVPDAPAGQDLLFASSGVGPLSRHALIPARSFLAATYSTVLPYRVGTRVAIATASLDGAGSTTVTFGARADSELRAMDGDFGSLRSLAARGALRFDLLAAGAGDRWEQVGSLVVEGICAQEVSRDLHFNPWNTIPSLQPAGPLNTLRNSAYKGSQRARPA